MNAHGRALVAAFTFLTRLPVARFAAHDASDLPLGSVYFPIVGLMVGVLGGVAYAASARLWPAPLPALLAVATTVLATGAFHEDALADALDGFGGGWDREQVLAIMKDSRIGSYALVGVLLTIAAKIAAISAIAATATPVRVACALIAAHVLGRWSSVLLMGRYAYVRRADAMQRPSAGQPFVAGVSRGRVLAATAIAAAIVIPLLGGRSVPVFAAALGLTIVCGRYFARRIGGVTGDALGAANQLVELAVYLTLAARIAS